jgi:hypothetical protein
MAANHKVYIKAIKSFSRSSIQRPSSTPLLYATDVDTDLIVDTRYFHMVLESIMGGKVSKWEVQGESIACSISFCPSSDPKNIPPINSQRKHHHPHNTLLLINHRESITALLSCTICAFRLHIPITKEIHHNNARRPEIESTGWDRWQLRFIIMDVTEGSTDCWALGTMERSHV